jgi:hypothetical protein
MAMGVCRECGNKVSSEAPTCPKCGATNPYKAKRIGVIGWLGVGLVGLVAFTMCTPRDEAPTRTVASTTNPPATQSPTKSLAQIETENRAAMLKLEPKQLRPIIADKLLPICEKANPSLNYIKTEVRGTAIYCVHSFYSQHSLSIGPLAGQLERFINDWQIELSRAGVKRVGVYGTGEFATGSYFDLK